MISLRGLAQCVFHNASSARILASSSSHVVGRRRQSSTRSSGGGGGGGGGRLGSRLGQTSVFYQTGLKISELPLVVKKVNDVLNIADPVANNGGGGGSGDVISNAENGGDVIKCSKQKIREEFLQSFDDVECQETREIIAGLRRCFTVSGIFRLLETIPAEEVTPSVAVEALKLILTLESSSSSSSAGANQAASYRQTLKGVRRLTGAVPGAGGGGDGDVSISGAETFLRHAFMNMLLDLVYRSRNPQVLIEGLEIVCDATRQDDATRKYDANPHSTQEMSPNIESHHQNHQESNLLWSYKKKIYEEILVLVTEGLFSLMQICDVIRIANGKFSSDKKLNQGLTDKLWSGLLDKATDLKAEHMVHLIKAAADLKEPRPVVLTLIRNRMGDFWQEYEIKDILEMLRVMTEICDVIGTSFTRHVMPVISSWLLRHIHTLSEEQLLAVVCCFSKISYYNNDFKSMLNKYVKIRGCYIQDANLVAAICDYCIEARVRSEEILNGASEYFVSHSKQLTTPQLHSIARIFGELDFHPSNGFQFWERMEEALSIKFNEFPPKDMIKLMLSFVYIERYPLNFVRRLFNPHFLDRIHNQPVSKDVQLARFLLTHLDLAMKFECPLYDRSAAAQLLSKSGGVWTSWSSQANARMANFLFKPLGEVVGDVKRIDLYAKIPSLPHITVDMMIHPSTAASILTFGFASENSKCVAVLIHTQNHYDRSGCHLIGSQSMRVRHLKKMGFRVMQLKYDELSRLRQNSARLHQVLSDHYHNAT